MTYDVRLLEKEISFLRKRISAILTPPMNVAANGQVTVVFNSKHKRETAHWLYLETRLKRAKEKLASMKGSS